MRSSPDKRQKMLLAGAASIVLIALIAIGGAWFLLDGEDAEHTESVPAPGGEAAGGRERPDDAMLMEATTPEELRQVVSLARNASAADLPALREMALSSPDPLVAGNAIRALGRLGAVGDDPRIIELFDDPRPRVRQEMVLALGESGDRSLEHLLIPLLDDTEANLRHLAIRALGQLAGPQARSLLEKIASDEHATRTERVFARSALASLDKPRRIPVQPAGARQ